MIKRKRMIQAEELILESYKKGQLCLKYMRRKDISPALRLYIGSIAIVHSERIKELTQKYEISRSFVYVLRSRLLQYGPLVFAIQEQLGHSLSEEVAEQLNLLRTILSYRLEGRCSILGISTLLKRQDFKVSSIGYISEVLQQIGKLLGNVVEVEKGLHVAVVFASDEMFSVGRPLLITVDPVSSAILHLELGEDRSSLSWALHWQELIDRGLTPILVTGDEGTGMKKGKEWVSELTELTRQSDVYHAIAHRLGDTRRILEAKAYAAIEEEYKREAKIASAKTERVIVERFAKWEAAIDKCTAAMELFDSYQSCYKDMLDTLCLFDQQGRVLRAKQSRTVLQNAIERMKMVGHKSTNKELETIQRLVEQGLFNFQRQAQQVVYDLEQLCTSAAQLSSLRMICSAYQARKNYRKVKDRYFKKYYKQQEQQRLLQAQSTWQTTPQMNWDFTLFQKRCYGQLDQIILGSSMVETINSIVRMYVNGCKNQISQPYLNLVMFYHNHRRYIQGARKGYTPMELLTGQPQQKDWLDLLMDKVGTTHLPDRLQVAYAASQQGHVKNSPIDNSVQQLAECA